MATLRRQTTQECKVEECDRLADGSRGWCWAHYMRWYQSRVEPTGPVAPQRAKPEPCEVDGCTRNARAGALCNAHAQRAARNGLPGAAVIEAKSGHNRGRTDWTAKDGYRWLRRPDHPNAYSNGTVLEHVVVMAEMIGRPLVRGENVHHKNGDRADNRPENLELWSTHQPKGESVADKLAWAREIIDLYGDVPVEVLA